jgi:hypothetical protein
MAYPESKGYLVIKDNKLITLEILFYMDRLCGLVVRVQFPALRDFLGKKKKKVVGLERGPLSLVSTTEELLDRKVAAPV